MSKPHHINLTYDTKTVKIVTTEKKNSFFFSLSYILLRTRDIQMHGRGKTEKILYNSRKNSHEHIRRHR